MRLAIYHGYELTGSGSNEFTRYLSRALSRAGHDVHVLCREPNPEKIAHVSSAYAWSRDGEKTRLVGDETEPPGLREGMITVHVLPHAEVRPVYVTDKQRAGVVKAFRDLDPQELTDYHDLNVEVVTQVIEQIQPDLVHANHLVYQPIVAREVFQRTGVPYVIYPHGSSIEYTLRADSRYLELARAALADCEGWMTGNIEVRDRVLTLYPELEKELLAKHGIAGVGVDTSLFQPFTRAQRSSTIQDWGKQESFSGKTKALKQSFAQRFRDGDWDVLNDLRNQYDQSSPDEDAGERLGSLRDSDPLVLYVGALTSGKGVQSLLAAFALLKPDARLLVVGGGSYREVLEGFVLAASDGDEETTRTLVRKGHDLDCNDLQGPWSEVEAAFESLGSAWFERAKDMGERIHFLGRMSHDWLHRVFPLADVAVFPSQIPEAYPLVLMESLANGVLPVVSDFSGFRDGLDELESRLGKPLVDRMRLPVDPSHKVEFLAKRLNELLSARDSWNRSDLRALAEEAYDWQTRAVEFQAAYQRACRTQTLNT